MWPNHHLLAFASSVANGAALANVGRLNDQIFNNNSSGYTATEPYQLGRVAAQIENGTALQFDSPTLRQIGPPNISPFWTAAAVPDNPPIARMERNARTIPRMDFFNAQVSRAGAGAANTYVLAWMQRSAPVKDTRVCTPTLWSGTAIAAAMTWASSPLTATQNITPGRYAIIGMAVWGANVFAARLIFPNQVLRPGVLAQQGPGEYLLDDWRYGNYGTFGEFQHDAPPQLEVLGSGATAAQVVLLDIVPLQLNF